MMNKCSVYCVNNEKDMICDILEQNDKRIKVVLEDTDFTITLSRSDTRRPYIGFSDRYEFETFGELEE